MLNNYTAESIKSMDYFEHIRQYPGMYIGSKDINGLHHCIKEILSNSIDEFLNGAGDTIKLVLQKDGGIYIKDNGRGIPHGKHESGCSILQACYGIANTGGKFDNATGETGYNTSGGEHGTGGKAVNALSIKMIVTTSRDGIKEIVEFSQGKFIKYFSEKSTDNGVSVLFYPDNTVLEVTKPNSSFVENMMREFSFLCSGLTFIFIDENTNKKSTFLSTKGLYDYINFLNKNKSFLCEPIYFSEKENMYQVEVALAYNDTYNNIVKLYTNNIPQEKGTHLTGFKTAFTTTFNNFAREKKWLKEKDQNLTGSDLEEGQILIINFKMIDPVFKGQNKEELSSSEGRTYVQKLSSIALKKWFEYNEKEIKVIADKAINAKKAREAAKKARERAREQGKEKKNKILNLPTKLVDANSKNRLDCELFICEGDSAAGGLIAARDPEIVGVFPIRGKMINAYKNNNEKVMANAEINNLIKALGLDLDPKTNKLIYDIHKLRYGKIFTACDADPDGQAIKNLIMLNIWSLCPELILNGHMWITIPPLYRITKNKNTYIYLKDDKELNEYKEKHKGEKYLINRNKGLGEQDSEELEPALLNPKTRNVAQIIVESKEEAEYMFDLLLGPSVPPRREWLLEHSEEASDNIW